MSSNEPGEAQWDAAKCAELMEENRRAALKPVNSTSKPASSHEFADKVVIPVSLKTRWVWCSTLCLLCFAGYVFVSKLGLKKGVPETTMFFLFLWGSLLVALLILPAKRFRLEKSFKGVSCGTMVGILSGVGLLAMLTAFTVPGANTSVISTFTGLYPMVTVILAVLLLRERLTTIQSVGIGFAVAAIIVFARDPNAPISLSATVLIGMSSWVQPAAVVLVAWGVVGIFQKLATNHISAASTVIWQTVGYFFFLPFVFPADSLSAIATLGLVYGVLGGVFNNLGSWFLFAALESGGKISIVVPFTALYPVVVVFLAPLILQESITLLQGAGVVSALFAIVLLST